jgi:hypothetical protein
MDDVQQAYLLVLLVVTDLVIYIEIARSSFCEIFASPIILVWSMVSFVFVLLDYWLPDTTWDVPSWAEWVLLRYWFIPDTTWDVPSWAEWVLLRYWFIYIFYGLCEPQFSCTGHHKNNRCATWLMIRHLHNSRVMCSRPKSQIDMRV